MKYSFYLPSQSFEIYIFDQTSLHGLHEILPACSICPLKAVGAGELQQGWGEKTGAADGALALKLALPVGGSLALTPALVLALEQTLALDVGALTRKKTI